MPLGNTQESMQRPDDKKRQLILQTAANLFASQPFHKVRLEDVAAGAGVGKGTLYIYFSSKEDLYYSILYGGFAQLVDGLATQLKDSQASAWDRLELIVTGLVEFAFAHPELFELMRTVAPPIGKPEWAEKRQELSQLIEEALVKGVAARQLKDPNPPLTALFIPGLVRSAMLYGPKSLRRQTLIGQIMHLLRNGLGAGI
jgi:AcrR family transcriptional regulator